MVAKLLVIPALLVAIVVWNAMGYDWYLILIASVFIIAAALNTNLFPLFLREMRGKTPHKDSLQIL